MTDRRPTSLVAVMIIACSVFVFAPTAGADGVGQQVRTVEPPPTSTPPSEPEPTQPETTEPAPETSDDESSVTAVTVISLLAFALLLVLASWWMVSRRDDDDAPHPRPPGVDEPLPGQDLL